MVHAPGTGVVPTKGLLQAKAGVGILVFPLLRLSFAAARTDVDADLRDCAGLLQRAGFALPVADVDELRLLYADPFGLLRDLRSAGETNALRERDRRVPPRELFAAALAALPEAEGRAIATLRLAVMTGWAGDAPRVATG